MKTLGRLIAYVVVMPIVFALFVGAWFYSEVSWHELR